MTDQCEGDFGDTTFECAVDIIDEAMRCLQQCVVCSAGMCMLQICCVQLGLDANRIIILSIIKISDMVTVTQTGFIIYIIILQTGARVQSVDGGVQLVAATFLTNICPDS